MTDLIPREVLFGHPERVSPQISPDGTRLAWIAPQDGVLNVWVAPVAPVSAGGADGSGVDWDAAQVVTDDTDRGIRAFAWARDARHLLYIQDTGGDENWRLYDIDLQTGAKRDLTPYDGIQARIIATRKSHRDEILVGMNRDNPQLHDVYRLDLPTGELVKVIENPGYAGWVGDGGAAVRAALAPRCRAVFQRRRPQPAGDQLGRRGYRQALPDRSGHRRDRRAARGSRGGRRWR